MRKNSMIPRSQLKIFPITFQSIFFSFFCDKYHQFQYNSLFKDYLVMENVTHFVYWDFSKNYIQHIIIFLIIIFVELWVFYMILLRGVNNILYMEVYNVYLINCMKKLKGVIDRKFVLQFTLKRQLKYAIILYEIIQ